MIYADEKGIDINAQKRIAPVIPISARPADEVRAATRLLCRDQRDLTEKNMEEPKETRAADDDRPLIRLSTELHIGVTEAARALALDSGVYQRDGMLVRVVHVAEADTAREGMAAGTPQIRPVAAATLTERLTRQAKFERFDGRREEWVPTIPPSRVVHALADRGEWDGVRPIVGIIETPSMRPDGTLIVAKGYDGATGYVYAPRAKYPRIADAPTQADAVRALAELAKPFAEFPFHTEADRYVLVAALLTLLARPAIRGAVPAFVFDATTKGSGKTLCARAVSTLAHGREAALMTWPPDDTELEKVLGAYALRGAAIIVFDNVSTSFGGPSLDKVLTCADRTELRILGVSQVPSLSWRAVVVATGNNVVVGGDTTRRVLVSRLEPMCENPEERDNFEIGDLPGWCRANHPRIVAAGLTLLRGFVVANRPRQDLAGWGSFEAWRDLIGAAIVWAGGTDVMATRPTLAGDDDSETSALRTIVALWPMLVPDGATVSTALNALYPALQHGEHRPPDAFTDLREALETLAPPKRSGDRPAAQRLGVAFGRNRRRVIGGKYLDRGGDGERAGTARWIVREVNP